MSHFKFVPLCTVMHCKEVPRNFVNIFILTHNCKCIQNFLVSLYSHKLFWSWLYGRSPLSNLFHTALNLPWNQAIGSLMSHIRRGVLLCMCGVFWKSLDNKNPSYNISVELTPQVILAQHYLDFCYAEVKVSKFKPQNTLY